MPAEVVPDVGVGELDIVPGRQVPRSVHARPGVIGHGRVMVMARVAIVALSMGRIIVEVAELRQAVRLRGTHHLIVQVNVDTPAAARPGDEGPLLQVLAGKGTRC